MLVGGNTTLVELHEIFHIAIGWEGYHHWTFSINGTEYGHAYGLALGREIYLTILADLGLRLHEKFLHDYDFGDYLQHESRPEKTLVPEPGKRCPTSTGGKRACPPEDCGGPWAYQEPLHLASSPFRDHERRQALEVLGRSFDPEAFDLRSVNAQTRPKYLRRIGGRTMAGKSVVLGAKAA